MRVTLLTILMAVFNSIVLAQNQDFAWAISNNGASGHGIVTDGQGNVYSTGFYMGTTDLDPGSNVVSVTSNGSKDVFIQKLDSGGNFIWGISIGGSGQDEANDIAIDPFGNVIVTGSYTGTVDFDPGIGIHNETSNGSNDIFVLKLDPINGTLLWVNSLGDYSLDEGVGCKIDNNGDIIVAGNFRGTVDFDAGIGVNNVSSNGNYDVFVMKILANGDFSWVKTIGGTSQEIAYTLDLDKDGNIIVGGKYAGSVDFDPGAGVSNLSSVNGGSDAYVVKLDDNGNYLWANSMGGSSLEAVYDLAIDTNKNVILTGQFSDTADFDPGVGVVDLISAGARDIFVQKFDENGSLLWVHSLGGTDYDQGNSIAVDNSGSIYVSGNYDDSFDFDPGAGVFNLTAVNHNPDAYVLKLDTNGDFVWAKSMGGTAVDRSNAITVDELMNVFVTGYFAGTADFDPSSNVYNITVSGQAQFIVKLGECSTVQSTDAVVSCDPYTWIDGVTYTTSNNTATHTISTPGGCDTIVTLDLTIAGSTTGTDVQTSCSSFTWMDGITYTTDNNTATHTLTNAAGCDSIVTLNLTINQAVNVTYTETDPTITANAVGANYQWLDCDNGYAVIPGATSQSFTATTNGNYAVEVTENGCSDTSSCVTIELVGVSDFDNHNGVKVYPNPTNNWINVEIEKWTDAAINVFDVNGKLIYSKSNLSSNLLQFQLEEAPGVYFLEVSGDDKTQRFKLIKW